jgi:hypothetical protein
MHSYSLLRRLTLEKIGIFSIYLLNKETKMYLLSNFICRELFPSKNADKFLQSSENKFHTLNYGSLFFVLIPCIIEYVENYEQNTELYTSFYFM